MRASVIKWPLVVLATGLSLIGLSLMSGQIESRSAVATEGIQVATSTPGPQPPPTPSAEAVRPPRPSATRAPLGRESALKPRGPAVELPRWLSIESIGVDAEFEYVGVTGDGAMDVPKDPNRVAWYQLGPRPGEQGNATIAGHVDWGGNTAVFWRLRDLKGGEPVEVVAMDGRKYDFAVQWVRWYEASSTDLNEVFGQSNATELTMITCGGDFDPDTREYLSRVVVRAIAR